MEREMGWKEELAGIVGQVIDAGAGVLLAMGLMALAVGSAEAPGLLGAGLALAALAVMKRGVGGWGSGR